MRPYTDRILDSSGALKGFLRERRARILPESFGLPARTRGTAAGLRREDVAELMNVSTLWYALFESGTSHRRFSAAFLNRLAEILALGKCDRDVLFRLVLACGCGAPDVQGEWDDSRWNKSMNAIADMARTLAVERSIDGAAKLACGRLRGLLDSALPGITLWLEHDGAFAAVHYEGRDNPAAIVGRTLAAAAWPEHCEVRGSALVVPRLGVARVLDVASANSRSAIIVPVGLERLLGILCIDSPFPNAFTQREAEITQTFGKQLGHALMAASVGIAKIAV
jgi:transcriptional regulator with XRE-family HTH domain